jgi:hypothetical protein
MSLETLRSLLTLTPKESINNRSLHSLTSTFSYNPHIYAQVFKVAPSIFRLLCCMSLSSSKEKYLEEYMVLNMKMGSGKVGRIENYRVAACDDISPDILIRVKNNWVDRLHRCLAQKGAHIEHLM